MAPNISSGKKMKLVLLSLRMNETALDTNVLTYPFVQRMIYNRCVLGFKFSTQQAEVKE